MLAAGNGVEVKLYQRGRERPEQGTKERGDGKKKWGRRWANLKFPRYQRGSGGGTGDYQSVG